MNIPYQLNDHPLHMAVYNACQQIEKCGASTDLTTAVVMVSDLQVPIATLRSQLKSSEDELKMWKGTLSNVMKSDIIKVLDDLTAEGQKHDAEFNYNKFIGYINQLRTYIINQEFVVEDKHDHPEPELAAWNGLCRNEMIINGENIIPRSCPRCGIFNKCQKGYTNAQANEAWDKRLNTQK